MKSPLADSPPLGPAPAGVAPTEPGAPPPPPGADKSGVGEPGAPAPADPAPADPAPAGTVWCEHCRSAVVPSGRGVCPTCGRFLPDNTIALVTGLRSKKLAKIVDAYRVELLDQLFAERGGRDRLSVVERIQIENYALVCAQHKTIEARLDQDGLFTQTGRRRSAFDMLKSISETIDRLRAQLPPPIASVDTSDLDNASNAELIERASAILQHLLEMEHSAARARDAGPSVQASTDPAGEVAVPTSAPAPEPVCEFCHRPCVGVDHPAYRVLHWSDPVEVARRDAEATTVMMHQVGRGVTWE